MIAGGKTVRFAEPVFAGKRRITFKCVVEGFGHYEPIDPTGTATIGYFDDFTIGTLDPKFIMQHNQPIT